MLDIAIVGGGVCGLALARKAEQRGLSYALYEARTRFGGRILSRLCQVSAIDVDLGAAWFWPDTQPLISGLVAELGLEAFPQHDDGTALVLAEADKDPRVLEGETLHAGASRLEGGMQALINALLATIPPPKLHLAHVLRGVTHCGGHVELAFEGFGETETVTARRVVLALPPRLAEEHVAFAPALDAALQDALLGTPTWMAAEAKAVMAYGERDDLDLGARSGNAFVHHDQAVLGEIFNASGPGGEPLALGGFLSLSPELRRSFRDGLPLLLASQFAQVFGPGFDQGELHCLDWATEFFTCATQDRRKSEAGSEVAPDRRQLRAAHWDGMLIFAGSETAERGAGQIEGALDAASRAENLLLAGAAPARASTTASLSSSASIG